MKHITIIAAIAASLIAISCNKIEDPATESAKEAYIDATSKTTWTYFSLSKGETVGTGEETAADNAAWASRTDWDLAICRYNVRTNSGTSTTAGAKGGIYTSALTFDTLNEVPSGAVFETDKIISSTGMSGETSVSESTATVISFQTNADGSKVMPPVYLKAPVYILRTADGSSFYKVEFTQYQDENKTTGQVKFNFARIK